MRRVVQPSKSFYNRAKPCCSKYILGYILLLVCLVYSYKDTFYFNNGLGAVDWSIGKPKVNLWNAHNTRSLTELRVFALELINRDRQLNRLPPLVEDSLLAQSAQSHAEDMKARNYYAHLTPEGRTPTDRFASIGGQGGVGENIMLQSQSIVISSRLSWGLVENFQKSWMYSNGHRANLLNPHYTRVGYGIVSDPMTGKVYAVQNFQ